LAEDIFVLPRDKTDVKHFLLFDAEALVMTLASETAEESSGKLDFFFRREIFFDYVLFKEKVIIFRRT
jgi:hypothetical protein